MNLKETLEQVERIAEKTERDDVRELLQDILDSFIDELREDCRHPKVIFGVSLQSSDRTFVCKICGEPGYWVEGNIWKPEGWSAVVENGLTVLHPPRNS